MLVLGATDSSSCDTWNYVWLEVFLLSCDAHLFSSNYFQTEWNSDILILHFSVQNRTVDKLAGIAYKRGFMAVVLPVLYQISSVLFHKMNLFLQFLGNGNKFLGVRKG